MAALVSSDEGKQLLAGHRAYITVAYFDLRGFTAFAETAEPEELIEVVREYHTAAGDLVRTHGGTLEHFAGDGLMVFFNDQCRCPTTRFGPRDWRARCASALASSAPAGASAGTRLGLGAGMAVTLTLGRIGFEGRYDYGALGIVTSLAARLSDEASAGQILLSQRAHAALEGRVEANRVTELQMKGFARSRLRARPHRGRSRRISNRLAVTSRYLTPTLKRRGSMHLFRNGGRLT